MATMLVAAGMTAATMSTVGTVFTVLSATSAVIGGIASYQQGQDEADRAELQSRAEEINGRMQAIAVNDELLKTLSMNNASAAATGLQSSGSVARAGEAAQRKATQELNVNRFNTEMKVSGLKRKAKSAAQAGTTALTGSLFDAVGTAGSAFKTVKET